MSTLKIEFVETASGPCFWVYEYGYREVRKLRDIKLTTTEIALMTSLFSGSVTSEQICQQLQQLDNRIRLAKAFDLIKHHFSRFKDPLFIDFFIALYTFDDVVQFMDECWGGYWDRPLVQNKRLSTAQIETIYDKLKDHYPEDPYHSALDFYAKLPACPAYILEALLKYDKKSIRRDVARHKHINQNTMNFFINSRRKAERLFLLQSKWISQEALLALAQDSNPEVAEVANYLLQQRSPTSEIS
ncbi:hypothetical protein [Motilimonas sp. KMU-193]|uniref:hypothetical protein n=1 Tax=Motilimonas sp. KMU-193 TaxID=3388668 RepID=UPI00396AFEB9